MKRLILIATLLMLSGIAVHAQKIKVEINKDADLSRYRTYVWVNGISAKNPYVHQQIVNEVDRALVASGLTKVEVDGDVHVLYFASSDVDLHISHADWGWMPGKGGMPISQSWSVPKGTLQVSVTDGKSHDQLWRGTASDTLQHEPTMDLAKDARDLRKLVKKSVEKMFKKFPRKP